MRHAANDRTLRWTLRLIGTFLAVASLVLVNQDFVNGALVSDFYSSAPAEAT